MAKKTNVKTWLTMSVLLVVFLGLCNPAAAKTWTGSENNNWSDANNWSPMGEPNANDDVNIPNVATTPSIYTSDAVCGSLTIEAYSTVYIDGNDLDCDGDISISIDGTLTVSSSFSRIYCSGNWTNNGTFTHGSSMVRFDGDSDSTIGGTTATSFYILRVQKAALADRVFLTTNDCDSSYETQVYSGTLDFSHADVTFTSIDNIQFSQGNPSLLRMDADDILVCGAQLKFQNGAAEEITGGVIRFIGSSNFLKVYGTADFTPTGGTLEVGSVAGDNYYHNEGTVSLYNLHITGNSTFQPSTNPTMQKLVIGNDLIIDSGSTLNMANGVGDINDSVDVAGDWTNDGTFNAGTGTVTFNGTSTINAGGTGAGRAFYNVELHGTSATLSPNDIDIDGDFTITSGTWNTGGSNMYVGANWTNNGTFDAGTGTVTFDGSGSQYIYGNTTFYYLTIANTHGANAVTLGANLTADVTLVLHDTLETSSYAVSCSSLYIYSTGEFNAGSNTTSLTVSASLYMFDGSEFNGSTSSSYNINVNHWIMNGGTVHLQDSTVSITTYLRFFAVAAGNFYCDTSEVTIGTNLYSDSSGVNDTFYLDTASVTINGYLNIDSSDFTVEANGGGTLDVNDYVNIDGTLTCGISGAPTIYVGGNWTNNGTFTHGSSTVTFDGTSGAQTVNSGGFNFYNIEIDNSGTSVQLTAGLTQSVGGVLTMTAGTLDLNAYIWTLGADFSPAPPALAVLDLSTGGSTLTGSTYDVTLSDGDMTITQGAGTITCQDYSQTLGTHTISGTLNTRDFSHTGGAFTCSGTTSINASGNVIITSAWTNTGSTITMTGTSKTINASQQVNNLSISNGATVSIFTNDLSVGGTLTVGGGASGSLDTNSKNLNVTGTTAINNGATFLLDGSDGSTLIISDTLTNNGTFTIESDTLTVSILGSGAIRTFTGNDIDYNTNSVKLTNIDYDPDVTLDEAGDTIVLGDSSCLFDGISIGVGGVASTFNAGGYDFTISGNFTNTATGTFMSTGTVTFDGTSTINSGGTGAGKAFYNVELNGTSATLSTNDIDIDGNFTITSGTWEAEGNNMYVGGNWTNNDTFNAGTGTVTLDGSGNQTISTGETFYGLTINKGGGDLRITDSTTVMVNGAFTIAGSTPTITGTSSGGYGLTLNGDIIVPGANINYANPVEIGGSGSVTFNNVSFTNFIDFAGSKFLYVTRPSLVDTFDGCSFGPGPDGVDRYNVHVNASGTAIEFTSWSGAGGGEDYDYDQSGMITWVIIGPVQVLYVDGNSPPGGDGLTWETAFNYLQDALDVEEDGNNINIWVADGTYNPDANSTYHEGSGDREATFGLKNGVGIRGGYAGYGAANPNKRDIELYETILSGDLDGNDTQGVDPYELSEDPNRGENSYHVVTGNETEPNTILDGFTITAGNANGSYPDNVGGGMSNDSNGNSTVTNCTFSRNSAGWGGGMWNDDNSNPTISNCTFTENSATVTGGGIRNEDASSPTVVNCTFTNNNAESSGGMWNEGGSPTVVNCTFSGNSADSNGGGMYNLSSSPTVTNCTFSGNRANSNGGGVYNINSSPTITNCTFSGNSADFGAGGGMSNDNSFPTVTNCILWGNTAGLDGNEIAVANFSTIDVNYCDVEDGEDGIYNSDSTIIWGDNIDADPMFFDANNPDPNLRDYHLRPGSPCIDTGDNNSIPADIADLDGDANMIEPIPWDIDTDVRVSDGIVDMGSDEVIWDGATVSPAGPPVTLNPGGGPDDPNTEALVVFDNNSVGDANITVVEMSSDPHPPSGGFEGLGTTLRIETTLADGEFFMTVTVPFDANDLGDDDPCNVDLMYYDSNSGNWELAVAGNTDPCGGSRWVEVAPTDPAPTLATLGSRPLGDYGVYWNPITKIGFVWANVDHSTDFGGVVWLRGDFVPDGYVDFVDFSVLALTWQKAQGQAGYNSNCDISIPADNVIDEKDLDVFSDNWLVVK